MKNYPFETTRSQKIINYLNEKGIKYIPILGGGAVINIDDMNSDDIKYIKKHGQKKRDNK